MHVVWGPGQPRHRTSESCWHELVRWNAQHAKFVARHGRRRRVFVNQLSDTFDKEVPDSWRADAFDVMRATPHLEYLVLTKRIGNVLRMTKTAGGWPTNAALGISICNQPEADRDMPRATAVARQLPLLHLFASVEPMLGPIDFRPEDLRNFDQLIVGGESGPNARGFNIVWARSLVRQCRLAGVAPFVKQMGSHPYCVHDVNEPPRRGRIRYVDKKGGDSSEWPADLRIREFPNALGRRAVSLNPLHLAQGT